MIDDFSGPYDFLSNDYPCSVRIGISEYPSVTHAFEASKTIRAHRRIEIGQAMTAEEARQLSETVEPQNGWGKRKTDVMEDLLRQKFEQEELRDKLLETGSERLVYRNDRHDNEWGDCCCDECEEDGENKLGKLLMYIRGWLGTRAKFNEFRHPESFYARNM